MNTGGALLVELGVFGAGIDVTGARLLTTRGDLEVWKDVGIFVCAKEG